MKLDARNLVGPSLRPVLERVITWKTDSWPTSLIGPIAPLDGHLLIDLGARWLRIDAVSIGTLTVSGAGAIVALNVPSPFWDYMESSLPFRLVLDAAGWRLQQSADFNWYDNEKPPRTAPVGAWIAGDDNTNVVQKLRPSNHKPFPLDQLGIATSFAWPDFTFGKLGVFAGADPESPAVLAFLPYGDHNHSAVNACGGLPLLGLDQVNLGADTGFRMAPVLLTWKLAQPGGRRQRQRRWQALVQWQPLPPMGPHPSTHGLSAAQVIELGWNRVVTTALRGHRIVEAAQPWLALPFLKLKGSDFVPALVFDVSGPRAPQTPARLSRIHLNPAAPTTFEIALPWQADAAADVRIAAPDQLAGTGVTLTATLRAPGHPTGWGDVPLGRDLPQLLVGGIPESTDPTLVSEWTFRIDTAKSAIPCAWIPFGSLEISFCDSTGSGMTQAKDLICRLRGDWTATRCDLYPEIDLTLACRVRVSRLSDAGDSRLDAAFDALGADEEVLHGDTEGLRHNLGEDAGRICTLRIRHKSEPGRNALVEMSIRSTERNALGNEAFYFQARPFTVARVQPSEIDDQAGSLIAVWRSDDPEGVQWRLPDTTLSLALPPQAVAEEMERGNRFWPDDKSYIDATTPIRYRYSPPTWLVVRPSIVPRRYNKSPSNLAQALQGAKVDKFVTEIAYPIQIRFQVTDFGEPDIRIAETAAFLGRPAVNLPWVVVDAANGNLAEVLDARRRWATAVLPEDLAAWAAASDRWDAFQIDYRALRGNHSAGQANFAARLGQYHLFDPLRADGTLKLTEGLNFQIRDRSLGAPPLLNPLPVHPPSIDLLDNAKAIITGFLGGSNWQADAQDQGALRAGVLHTIEFASELASILRVPTSGDGSIDALAFTALGASGRFTAAFDEGRTTFIAESQHGQLSRLIKVRIGRIALLWNRAKHITVYERTTYPAEQFKDEQVTPASYGWPILRKTAEYIEPIDVIREFGAEAQKDVSQTGFVEASEFVSKRIYVNGAWGRDLRHGYELPLWNRADTSGFYPKPQLALRMQAGGDARSRGWLDKPEHLYFYSNTEAGAGGDPDHWEPKVEVDCPAGPARLQLFARKDLVAQDVLAARSLPSPRLGAAERPRFDLATVADGTVNLLHGRSDAHMLVALQVVSLARTDEAGRFEPTKEQADVLAKLTTGTGAAADIAAVQQHLAALIAQLPQRLLESGLDCPSLKASLHQEVDAAFAGVNAGLGRLANIDLTAVPAEFAATVTSQVKASVDRLGFAAGNAIQAAFESLRQDVKALLDGAMTASEAEVVRLRELVHGRLESLRLQAGQVVKNALTLLDEQQTGLVWGSALAQALLAELTSAVAAVDPALDPDLLQPQLDKVASKAGALRSEVEKQRKTPALAPIAVKLTKALTQIEQIVAGAKNWVVKNDAALKNQLDQLTTAIGGLITQVDTTLQTMRTAVTTARDQLSSNWQAVDASADTLQTTLLAVTDIRSLQDKLRSWKLLVDQALDASAGALVNLLKKNLKSIDDKIDSTSAALSAPLASLAAQAQGLAAVAQAQAATWVGQLHKQATDAIDGIDCAALGDARAAVEKVLRDAEARVRERVTDALSSVVDDATSTRLDQLTSLGAKVGKGIKLARAIGDMPQLPTLTFNADRAEYVFDDVKKQIDTSPFATRLREIDAGLKELGLAVPARQLLDQVIPDSLKDLDFGKVFGNLGGIDFQDLFKRFRLPELSSDKIKISHGLDKETRSAWVKTVVNADFPQEQTLFEFASVAVRVSNMALRANNDVRVAADGQRRAVTDGRFTGNWGLDFGGARMATFKDVTVRFDGSGFDFDVSPDKVELHPSLKFIQEYAKQFQDALPPAVQVEKDGRGVPVGVRASYSTVIDKLPPIPPVTIGPILLSSGLGLRMNSQGVFEVSTQVALGSKTAPIFVQVSYLGGGFWLEASCTAKGNKIEPRATLGLALGSMRAFNLAGVARGSYSILLFANAEVDEHGGSLHAGMTIQGSARILGIANASVALLLEVEHQSGGGTNAHGRLDVEIEICWCYKLKVHQAAEHKL